MRTEYKRDMNHNYLILYGEQDIDTASYQVRMLAGNVLPSILKCRMQRVDGNVMFYYEITSRQSISSLYEDKKFKMEDLQLIFGGFVQTLEEMGEYLLNPGQLVIDPEHVFIDVENKSLYFCYLPGYQKEVQEQFRSFTEYILPKLDHEDARAVMLGYGVYRSALEDGFHLEYLKKELYQVRDGSFLGTGEPDNMARGNQEEIFGGNPLTIDEISRGDGDFYEDAVKEGDARKEKKRRGKSSRKNTYQECGGKENSYEKKPTGKNFENDRIWENPNHKIEAGKEKQGLKEYIPVILFAVAAAVLMLGLLTANYLGYLPWLNVELTLGIGLCVLGTGLLGYFILRKKKAKEQKNWRKEVEKNRKSRERQERLLDEFPASADDKKREGRVLEREAENPESRSFARETGKRGSEMFAGEAGKRGFGSFAGEAGKRGSEMFAEEAGKRGFGSFAGEAGKRGSEMFAGETGKRGFGSFAGEAGKRGLGVFTGETGKRGGGLFAGETRRRDSGTFTGEAEKRGFGSFAGEVGKEECGGFAGDWEQEGFAAEKGLEAGVFTPGREMQKAESFGETVVLSANVLSGPASLVSREPGELASIYLTKELTIVGKLETACDAVISLPTVSRVHGKIRKRGEEYYLSDLNSRNGTSVNGKMLKGDEEYLLQNEDEVDFAQARYVFLK